MGWQDYYSPALAVSFHRQEDARQKLPRGAHPLLRPNRLPGSQGFSSVMKRPQQALSALSPLFSVSQRARYWEDPFHCSLLPMALGLAWGGALSGPKKDLLALGMTPG